jgi:hypothetical protein
VDWDDHRALQALADGYARGVDHRDERVFLDVFLPDAELHVHDPSDADEPRSVYRGHGDLARIPKFVARYAKTYHFVSGGAYELTADGATGEVHCMAHHLTPDADGGSDHVMLIRYRDEYRRDVHGAWKISERRVLVDWTEQRRVREV